MIYELLLDFDRALGLDFENADKYLSNQSSQDVPQAVVELAEKRWQAKQEKRWADADELRGEILNLGYVIKDSKEGYSIERA